MASNIRVPPCKYMFKWLFRASAFISLLNIQALYVQYIYTYNITQIYTGGRRFCVGTRRRAVWKQDRQGQPLSWYAATVVWNRAKCQHVSTIISVRKSPSVNFFWLITQIYTEESSEKVGKEYKLPGITVISLVTGYAMCNLIGFNGDPQLLFLNCVTNQVADYEIRTNET